MHIPFTQYGIEPMRLFSPQSSLKGGKAMPNEGEWLAPVGTLNKYEKSVPVQSKARLSAAESHELQVSSMGSTFGYDLGQLKQVALPLDWDWQPGLPENPDDRHVEGPGDRFAEIRAGPLLATQNPADRGH